MPAPYPRTAHRPAHRPSWHPHRRGAALTIAATLALAGPLTALPSSGATTVEDTEAIAPREAVYGYFVDTYHRNTEEFTTAEANPAIGVLSGMLEVWQPGTEWHNGTVLDEQVHEANIAQNLEIAETRTSAEEDYAYIIDRRHQSYSALEGLGPYAAEFRSAMNAGTTIPDEVPADASTVVYDDDGNANGAWADVDSELGNVTLLVNTVRGWYTTSNNAKNFYQYPRPFRWAGAEHVVIPSLEPRRAPEENAHTDGGFPSGHTNAAFLASLALAHAVPQQYGELVENAAAMGHSRIVAGMHSPLDVVGGRVLATAIAASVLNNPEYADVPEAAHEDAQVWIQDSSVAAELATDVASQEEYRARAAAYEAAMVEGFGQTGDTTVPAVVPKGAEVLVESRFPYLDTDQRRWLLRSTAIESGYPILDDAEGWGRLNLFAAAHGFGAFDSDVAVTLDAAEGGVSAADVWRNDIAGPGSFTLDGTGTLTLTGDNAHTGGTALDGGSLVAASPTALGSGDVRVSGGELVDATEATVAVEGDYLQGGDGVLTLSAGGDVPALAITGAASFDGTLRVELPEGTSVEEPIILATYGSLEADARFTAFEVTGADAEDVTLTYGEGTLTLQAAADTPTPTPTDDADPTPTGEPEPTPSDPAEEEPTTDDTGDDEPSAGGTPVGALPDTGIGARTGAFVATALALLGLGGAAVAVSRRRVAQRG